MKKMLTGNEIGPTPNNSRKCPPKCKPTDRLRDTHFYIECDLRRHTDIKIYTQVHAFNYMLQSNWAQTLDKSISFEWLITLTVHNLVFVCIGFRYRFQCDEFEWWRFTQTQYLDSGHFWNGQNEAKFTFKIRNQNRSDEKSMNESQQQRTGNFDWMKLVKCHISIDSIHWAQRKRIYDSQRETYFFLFSLRIFDLVGSLIF